MQAKSGNSISAVKPAAPEEVFDADDADAGKVEKVKAEQIKKKKGKYGKQKVKPFKPNDVTDDETKTSWIEFEMIDEADQPVPSLAYEVKLPDGSVTTGTLDGNGFARIDGCEPGTCEISFPGIDKDAWKKA